ncbi:MAG: histidine kinase, partial [Bacteroidales bacterium]|nr:histidine kinase [Bacteroidales bacterium]
VLVRNRESIEIQTKFETEQKDKEISSLSQINELQKLQLIQSRWMLLGLGGVVLLIILLAIILIRQNKLRNSRQTLLFQQRLLRTQMNPHFLFNSLSSIQNFIIRENPIKASDYLSRFAKLVRQILNNSVEEYVLLEDEISSIENYIELQKIRYRDVFDYSIEVDKEIDPETILIPPMLAQPFIENSIEHGFKHKDSMGNMKIRFRLNDKLIRFEVEDDGMGREKAKEILLKQNKDHRSMATDITRDRLKVLNKKLKQKIVLAIIDLKDEKGNPAGTKVTFDIPFKN